jgi:hypothetical protein
VASQEGLSFMVIVKLVSSFSSGEHRATIVPHLPWSYLNTGHTKQASDLSGMAHDLQ